MTRIVLLAALATAAAAQPGPEAYLAVLADPDARGHARLVAQAWPALPDSVRRALGPPDRPGVGAEVAAWWRGADPLPATPDLEGVAEHLRRVAVAVRRYPSDAPAGFDARGEVLVKLGEPPHARRLHSPTMRRASVYDRAPDNELWTYGRRGPVYLFVDDRWRGWRQAEPVDLIPFELRRTEAAPVILAELLPPMAVSDRNYLRVLHTVERALNPIEATPEFGLDTSIPGYQDRLAHNLHYAVRAETRRAMRQRDATVEPTGPALPVVVEMPLAVRVARFRAANGGTRVEVAYAPEPGAYVGLAGAHAVESVATLTEAGRPTRRPFPREAASLALPPAATRPGGTTPVVAATLASLGRHATVAVQVDVVSDSGATVRRAIRRVGPLAPLRPGDGGLLVSDPLPHLVPPGTQRAIATADRADAVAARERWRYPYGVVVPGADIGVYVEAYDLGTRGGRSRYEVERTVEIERGGERLFVSRSATASGTSSGTAREFVVLPVPAEARPGDRVLFEGVIRDTVTGRSGTWALAFGVAE
ncbi:hypothetical protein [Rubrivirga sp. IMCC43871]|uniref:hypothetical protein n=1 Tax=Rubrivirga sp. IMCC43871 TaxID=3391575 RepID=UPI00398FBAD9